MALVTENDFNHRPYSHWTKYNEGEISHDEYLQLCSITGNDPDDTHYPYWGGQLITNSNCDYCNQKLTVPMIYYTVKDLQMCISCAESLGKGLLKDVERAKLL